MAFPRSNDFETRQIELADAARALSHPARIALLEVLAARDTCSCGELVHELPLAQATVSQHLSVLKDAGFIQGTIEGPKSCYCLDREALRRIGDALESWFRIADETGECCPVLPSSDPSQKNELK